MFGCVFTFCFLRLEDRIVFKVLQNSRMMCKIDFSFVSLCNVERLYKSNKLLRMPELLLMVLMSCHFNCLTLSVHFLTSCHGAKVKKKKSIIFIIRYLSTSLDAVTLDYSRLSCTFCVFLIAVSYSQRRKVQVVNILERNPFHR